MQPGDCTAASYHLTFTLLQSSHIMGFPHPFAETAKGMCLKAWPAKESLAEHLTPKPPKPTNASPLQKPGSGVALADRGAKADRLNATWGCPTNSFALHSIPNLQIGMPYPKLVQQSLPCEPSTLPPCPVTLHRGGADRD